MSHTHNHSGKIYEKVSTRTLPQSEIEITLEISAENIRPFYEETLREISASAEFPGFRKGHAPANLVKERFGEIYILEEAVEHALKHVYPELLQELSLDPIAPPKVTITKLALDNPVCLRLAVALLPIFTLPDYKNLSQKIPKEEVGVVTEKEIDEVIAEIRRMRANPPTGGERSLEKGEQKEAPLPGLTDQNVSALGNFQSVAELRKTVSENLHKEKEWRAREKRRLAIVETLTSQIKVDLPEVLVESETKRMLERLKADLARMKLGLPEYLTHLKKTEEELLQSFRPEAEKRVLLELILSKIAAAENIAPSKEGVEAETERLLSHHRGADPTRAREYIENLLTNDKVFEFLENQS